MPAIARQGKPKVGDQKVTEPEEEVTGGRKHLGASPSTGPEFGAPHCARRDADPVTAETGGKSARLVIASVDGAVQGTGETIEGRTEGTTDVMIGGMTGETTEGALQQAHWGGGVYDHRLRAHCLPGCIPAVEARRQPFFRRVGRQETAMLRHRSQNRSKPQQGPDEAQVCVRVA